MHVGGINYTFLRIPALPGLMPRGLDPNNHPDPPVDHAGRHVAVLGLCDEAKPPTFTHKSLKFYL
jgi:hypothetical protein